MLFCSMIVSSEVGRYIVRVGGFAGVAVRCG